MTRAAGRASEPHGRTDVERYQKFLVKFFLGIFWGNWLLERRQEPPKDISGTRTYIPPSTPLSMPKSAPPDTVRTAATSRRKL